MREEFWKPIPDYEGLYEASSFGRIRSLDRMIPTSRNPNMFYLKKGRILKMNKDKDGYFVFSLHKEGVKKTGKAHKAVCEAFHGKSDLIVCHRDDNKENNNSVNLYWGTRSENEFDKVKNGINPNSKKIYCSFSHPLVMPNLEKWSWEKQKKRKCLSCSRAKQKARNFKRKNGELPQESVIIEWSHSYFKEISE